MLNMNKQHNIGSVINVPAPLDCLFLPKDSHWDVNQHIQPLICFIGTTSPLLMSKSTSPEVVMSHSWDYTVTSGYFSVSSKDILQKIRDTAKLLMMLILFRI